MPLQGNEEGNDEKDIGHKQKQKQNGNGVVVSDGVVSDASDASDGGVNELIPAEIRWGSPFP